MSVPLPDAVRSPFPVTRISAVCGAPRAHRTVASASKMGVAFLSGIFRVQPLGRSLGLRTNPERVPAVPTMHAPTSAAVREGAAEKASAAMPATIGAAMLVPVSAAYVEQVDRPRKPQLTGTVLMGPLCAPAMPTPTPPGAATSTPGPAFE